MIGSGESITGEELLRRYAAGERNFPFIYLEDGKAVLEGADLRGINLMAADLRITALYGTDLSDACLIGAVFNPLMAGVNLSNADLTGAYLRGAGFEDANLSRCILERAVLRQASFRNADLFKVQWDYAILTDVDLTGAKNFCISYIVDSQIEYYFDGILLWDTTMPDGTVIEGPILTARFYI